MATQDEGGRARILRVGQVSGSKWTVSVDDDPTPISEHRTRSEAEADIASLSRRLASALSLDEAEMADLGRFFAESQKESSRDERSED